MCLTTCGSLEVDCNTSFLWMKLPFINLPLICLLEEKRMARGWFYNLFKRTSNSYGCYKISNFARAKKLERLELHIKTTWLESQVYGLKLQNYFWKKINISENNILSAKRYIEKNTISSQKWTTIDSIYPICQNN